MALTVVTGMATGFGLFYRLLYVMGLTVLFSYLWNRQSLKDLEVVVDRRASRVSVGDPIEERITIRNRSALPKPMLEVEDLTDLPGYSGGMAVSLASRGFRSWRNVAPARRRGVYTMGPVRVSNTDLFGLFYRERYFCDVHRVVVYPRTYDLPGFAIPAALLPGESSARRRSHDLTPQAASVREYAFGDSISRVHWKSTARLGKLMSKEFDLGLSGDVWLLVDLHADVQAGELEESTDEYAVSIAASLARKYLQANLPVGLVAYGDRRYFVPAETGQGHFEQIMEQLAVSRAEGPFPLAEVLAKEDRLWGYNSSLVVITSCHLRDWVKALEELARRRVRLTVVLLDSASFGGLFDSRRRVDDLVVQGIVTYVVARGDDIPTALEKPYMPVERPGVHVPEEAGVTL